MTAKEEDRNSGGIGDAERVLLLRDHRIITVQVGSSSDDFWTIHHKLLTHHSPFFTAALNGSFKESATNTVELREDDPRAFTLFVQWLYTGKPNFDACDDLEGIACLAWALGDKLQCPLFQDHAMCELIASHIGFCLALSTVRLIYKTSPPSSRIRMFAVDQFLYDSQLRTENGTDKSAAAEIMAVEDFNRDILEHLLKNGGSLSESPADDGSRYLKVLDYDVWKEGED